jgi:hypothetical protein
MAGVPQPGDPMPAEVRQRVDRAIETLRDAMVKRDAERVDRAAGQVQEALGDWVCVPERKPDFRMPPDGRTVLDQSQLHAIWQRAWPSGLQRNPIPDVNQPNVKHSLLRHPAYVVLGGLAALNCGIGDAREIQRETKARLEYLLAVQRPYGLFPFADLRGTSSKFGPLLENHYRIWPEDFDKGFVVEDHLDGGLQFDNGVCAVTMTTAYETLKDERYLKAAKKACEWTLKRPIVVNWNYNAFSVWALARYVRTTGDKAFIAPAVERLRLGVLPGQTASGRWMDPHNARTVYHAIILRAMAELYGVLPTDETIRPRLKGAIEWADRVIVDEIRTHGATDADHSLSALCAVERVLGPDARRSEAIRVIGNAMYAQLVEPRKKVVHDLTLFAVGELLHHEASETSIQEKEDRGP